MCRVRAGQEGGEPEEWRPCPDYEGRYEVSDLGRIRSLPRTEIACNGHRRIVRGCTLKPALSTDGYLHVSLRKNGKLRLVKLHRLICRAFHGEQPNPIHKEAAHLDGNRTNARADNLKWVGKRQNESHKLLHGTHQAGERCPAHKITETQARAVKSALARGFRIASAARTAGVSYDCAREIARGRTWRHVSVAEQAQSPKSPSPSCQPQGASQ